MTSRIDFLLQKPIAHRGLHNAAKSIPENSFAAFKAAIIKGYPIEFDIHLLKDQTIAVFHDDNLQRLTGLDETIENLTCEQLPKLSDHSKIPTLEQVLQLVAGKVPLLIEFKTHSKKHELEQVALPFLVAYHGNFAIQSFNPHVLHFFKQHAPQIPRGQLLSPKPLKQSTSLAEYLAGKHLNNFYTRPDFLSIDLHRLPVTTNLPVLAWTIRDQAAAETAHQLAANIICEKII